MQCSCWRFGLLSLRGLEMTWTPPFQLMWQMDHSSFTNEAAVISKFILKLQAMGWKAFYIAHFIVSVLSSGSFEHLLTVIYRKRTWSWVSSFFLGACSTEKLLWNKNGKVSRKIPFGGFQFDFLAALLKSTHLQIFIWELAKFYHSKSST